MFAWIRAVAEARGVALREAEAIVYRNDKAALTAAAAIASDTDAGLETRRHSVRVLKLAIERQALAQGVDTATRHGIFDEWRNRRGSLIR